MAGSRPLAGLVSLEQPFSSQRVAIRGVGPIYGVGYDSGSVDGAVIAQGTAVRPGFGVGPPVPVKAGRVVEKCRPRPGLSDAGGNSSNRYGGTYRRISKAVGGGRNCHLLDYHRLVAAAFLFLPRKLKDAVDADAGNAGFPLGQPALLGGDKAPELAAFPEIDGVIPFIAVFAGGPGFGLAESIGLVNAAVKGFAPVFGQGFQDGGRPVGVGKGLPVGTVPGYRPGRGCWIPPPLRKMLLARRWQPLHCVGTWLFPLR